MKVVVSYTTVVTQTIEVDDKFQALRISDPGYDALTYGKSDG